MADRQVKVVCGDFHIDLKLTDIQLMTRDKRFLEALVGAGRILMDRLDPGFADRELQIVQQAIQDGDV